MNIPSALAVMLTGGQVDLGSGEPPQKVPASVLLPAQTSAGSSGPAAAMWAETVPF